MHAVLRSAAMYLCIMNFFLMLAEKVSVLDYENPTICSLFSGLHALDMIRVLPQALNLSGETRPRFSMKHPVLSPFSASPRLL